MKKTRITRIELTPLYVPFHRHVRELMARSAGGLGMTQNVVQNAGNTGMEMDGALAPGQIGVTARVTVSFELEE